MPVLATLSIRPIALSLSFPHSGVVASLFMPNTAGSRWRRSRQSVADASRGSLYDVTMLHKN